MGLLPQAHHEAAAPSSGVHPALQAWQGEASRCREADGQLLGAEGDHAGHESGRVRRPCCSKRTSGARVLPTTGFEELRRYDDVRVPEPSHQARHDLPRRQGLEHRQAPAEHGGRVRALAEQGPLAAPQATPGRPVANGEPAGVAPSPTSADRLRHQREHRELLVVQPRGPPEAATGLFRGLRASSRRAKDSDLLQRQRQGENSPGKLPGSHGGPRRGSGRVRHGVQPGHAAIRGRAQPPARREAFAPSPDLPATIKCRYNDVKVPAETFRIITVQDLAKLHHSLDDMAKICPPDLMLDGFEWRARPLDKVFDADTRAVLKRCVLVEVTAQCVKDSVRERRKFGSDKAVSMAESLRALYNGQ